MKKKIANWGNYPVMVSDERIFTFTDDLAYLLKNNSRFIARGNGRCYGDASLSHAVISTLRYDKILSFDAGNGIFECQSGTTLETILDVIIPKGWFLPVTPGTKYITVGGAAASDVHGKNHHVDGSFSNHIIEMDVMLADGSIMCCSPLQHTDLFWATCGGMGLTGIITRVKFWLKKIQTAYIRQKQIKAANLEEIIALFEQYKNYTYSVAWIDCLQKGADAGRSILMLGEHALPGELTAEQQLKPFHTSTKKKTAFPFYLPSFTLNTFTVSAFNNLYYHKKKAKEVNNIIPYDPFFYPLDAILHWNRGYGKKGFVQYQFVLPMESKQGLISILDRISKKGITSFLAVLKIFGKQDSLISFPIEGYTLALDFPVRKGLFEFLDELDKIVLDYGGRIYLSKDARMKAETFKKGYMNAEKFEEIIKKYNPGYKVHSLLSDRLLITRS
jgi:decaprenylphospho-beta-D-ribofuranose 2-oxidase